MKYVFYLVAGGAEYVSITFFLLCKSKFDSVLCGRGRCAFFVDGILEAVANACGSIVPDIFGRVEFGHGSISLEIGEAHGFGE